MGRLREERREVELDLQRVSSRWLLEREQKVKVENALKNLKNVEDELDKLAEESTQLDIEIKVNFVSIFNVL